MSAIFVAHIGGQHATHLAEALAQSGLLQVYATGMCATRPSGDRGASRRLGVQRVRVAPSLLKRSWLLGALASVPQRFIPASLRKYWNHLVWWAFGASAARRPEVSEANVVVAFENSALALFRRAKSGARSTICVLECPSVHHSAQDYGQLTRAGRRFVARINAIKNAELELADRIVVLSSFASRTFINAGIPAEKLHVMPMGVDTAFFGATEMPPPTQTLRFLFVGATTYSKGIDILVNAFNALPRGKAHLRIAGVGSPLLQRLVRDNEHVTTTGPLPHLQLRDEYRAAHVLVLPSRFDGFALVVTEAMATGRPVIVSSHVGAADLLATEGPEACGWIVPANDEQALAAAMHQAIAAAEALPAMGRAARRAVEAHSWESYARAVVAFYGGATTRA